MMYQLKHFAYKFSQKCVTPTVWFYDAHLVTLQLWFYGSRASGRMQFCAQLSHQLVGLVEIK